jgi:SAM-dependent methyltransferase
MNHEALFIDPRTGAPLMPVGGGFAADDSGETYPIEGGIIRAFVEDPGAQSVTGTVRDFYETTPFPDYNDFDTYEAFVNAAAQGVFARLLAKQIPTGARVLEAGCGTGQLTNYLSGAAVAEVFGMDASLHSLRLGREFADANGLDAVTFAHANLFYPCFADESMDVVISNGVLHHTADAKAGFQRLTRLVRPGGYVLIGLYNWLGRLPTDTRRLFRRGLGDTTLFLDGHFRRIRAGTKRTAWVRDQYEHPHETKHGIHEVLRWFDQSGISFVSSIPKIDGFFAANEDLFRPQPRGKRVDQLICELEMLATGGAEGGLFIMIGQRQS